MSELHNAIEQRRLKALADYRILDSDAEPAFDELTRLAAQICQVPMAIISLMDADRQWFKSETGLGMTETPRSIAFCERVVQQCVALTVADTHQDDRFRDNPLVAAAPWIRFYAGLPLIAPDGSCIGTLAVMDVEPRTLDEQQQLALETLSRMAMHVLELRRTRLALEDSVAEGVRLHDEVVKRDQAVEQAHDLLRFHLDNMPVAVVEFDAQMRVRRWSPQAQELFGWEEAEVLGQTLDDLDMVHPEDRQRVASKIQKFVDSQRPGSITLINRNVTRSGKELVCEWRNSVRFDGNGNLDSILSFGTDFTERVHTEQALKLSEERYRHATEASQAALWDFDMRTGKVTFSDAFREILGYERIEDMPDTLEAYMELMHPEDREKTRRKAEQLVAGVTGDRATAEFRLLTQSGEYRWVQSNSKVIRDAVGNAVRRLGSTVDIHEQRVAEVQLREQAERMRAVLEAARDAIITIDEDAVIESVNPATQDMFGYSPEELLGQNIRMLMPQTEQDRHDNYVRRYLETGKARIIGSPQRLQARRQDGSLFPIELMVSEVRLSGRRMFTGFIRDITVEEQARLALEASERRFRAVARTTTDVIWELNLESDTLWWSDEIEKAFGYTLAEAGTDLDWWTERVHPDDRDRVLAGLNEAIDKRTEWHDQYRFLHKNGHYADISDSGIVVAGEGGQPDRMVGGMTDITEQRQAREKLAEQASLLNKARDAIFVTDLEGVVTYWNQGAEQVYGWQADDMMGQSVVGCIVPDHDMWQQILAGLRATGAWEGQTRHRRRDGSQRDVQSHLTLVEDEAGKPRSILAINADITEKLALEEQLRHAQRMDSIGQLTGGVAHDFNNLLTVILGNAELLSESLDSAPALKTMAEMTRSAAQRGAELTGQLLAFARRQRLDPQTVDVAGLVTNMKPMLQRSMPEDIDIRMDHEPNPWPALVDASQLESALLNLALNARDAMPEGGRLAIAVRNVQIDRDYASQQADLESGDYVEIAISDTGHGISPEHVDRLFEPFFTTKEKGKGTGLGLPMVYGFVKQSNGHVAVHSEIGIGTTVRMYLPRAEGIGEVATSSVENRSEPHGTERILVVEDDPLVLDHVARMVERLGYQVIRANSGAEALDLVRSQQPFDLLFTDVIMPGGLRGPELAREVRRTHPGIRVLLTSGYTEDAISLESGEGNSFHLLQKPYNRITLAQKLREVLDDRAAAID